MSNKTEQPQSMVSQAYAAGKKTKPDKQKAQGPAAGAKGVEPPRESIGGWIALIIVLLLVVAAFAVFFALYYNWGGLRVTAANFLLQKDAYYQTTMTALQEQTAQLQEQTRAYESKNAELATREEELNKLQAQLESDTQKLAKDREALEAEKVEFMGRQENGEQLVATIAAMEASNAAQILEQLGDAERVADLLLRMEDERAAQILAKMKTKTAAQITSIMLERIQE